MLILIDNYDSFTYILADYFRQLGVEVLVFQNDTICLSEIEALAPQYLVISPGPGNPDQAGISLAAIAYFTGKLPILGVCLGHQAIGQNLHCRIIHARQIMHGKVSSIYHTGYGIFQGLTNPFIAMRYHSLVIDKISLKNHKIVSAWTQNEQGELDEIMGIQHPHYPVYGLQFHPESILTEQGKILLKNFINNH